MTYLLNRNDFKLLLEGRSTPLTLEGVTKLLKEHCTVWCNKGVSSIYRGIKNNDDYLTVDPSQFERESIGMKDVSIYQNVIDTSKDWEMFPKRSESIICTNNALKAGDWGTIYEVVPFDNANIAVAPKSDIWYSFNLNNENNTSNTSLEDLNRFLIKLPLLINGLIINVNTKEDYVKYCEFIQNNLTKLRDLQTSYENDSQATYSLYQKYLSAYKPRFIDTDNDINYNFLLDNFESIGVVKTLEKILSPEKFKLLKYDSQFKLEERPRELWTDSKCILIRQDLVKDLVTNIL